MEEGPALIKEVIKEEKRTRERSAIAFPYNDLDDVVKVAEAIHQIGGSQARLEQIVKPLNHDNISSGAFRLKLSAARMFGLIEFEGQQARLTDLGRRIVQSDTTADARAEAFLRVPLYREIYGKYSGFSLPHDVGLESELESLGVSQKSKAKARQVFQRSAREAGFFAHGKDRLVSPIGAPATKLTPPTQEDSFSSSQDARIGGTSGGGTNGDGSYHKHPLMVEYLKTMPPLKSEWEEPALDEWLDTFKRIVRVIRPTTTK